MAILVIKNAADEGIRCTCEECGSVLEYTFKDIQREVEHSLFGSSYARRYIVCPVCKSDVRVEKRQKNEAEIALKKID